MLVGSITKDRTRETAEIEPTMLVDKSVFSEPVIFLAIATWKNSKGSCDHVGHELVKAGVRRDYADFTLFERAPWLILQSDKPNNKMKCNHYESAFFL